MNALVVDASVAISWILPSQQTDAADELFARRGDYRIIAPALFSLEVRNILLVAERKKRIASEESDAELQSLGTFVNVVADVGPTDLTQILAIARSSGLTVYDAAYLDLARRRGAPLASRDAALIDACAAVSVETLDVR